MKKNATEFLPAFTKPELIFHEKRLFKACNWVENHRNEIHSSISFIETVELYVFGIDVTQLKQRTK